MNMKSHPVSTLELFFDLVFVFTVTQLTVMLADGMSWLSLGQVSLIFVALFWMYGGYTHLTNQFPPDSHSRRLALIMAMGGFLVCAMAIPKVFDGHGAIFGIGYLSTVLIHGAMFAQVHGRSVLWFTLPNILGSLLIMAAGHVSGTGVAILLWSVALAMQLVTPILVTRFSSIRMPPHGGAPIGSLSPHHLVERHGLLLIITLGETLISIGVGIGDLSLGAGMILGAILTLWLIAGLWWCYFIDDEHSAANALLLSQPTRRFRMALSAYYYSFTPMLIGIAVLAAGIKKSIAHPGFANNFSGALALAGGVSIFLLGNVSFRLALGARPVIPRAMTAIISLTTIIVGVNATSLLQLAALAMAITTMLVTEYYVSPDRQRKQTAVSGV